MQIRRVRVDDAEIDRFVEECWIPYHEAVGEAVSDHSLVDDIDHEDVVGHHRELIDSPSARLWVALDGIDDPPGSLSNVDATFAGFVRTSLKTSPPSFDWPPARIHIHDLWVEDAYRGSGLADELVARVRRQARENGCERLDLTVGIENERALAYFEALGFEPQTYDMHVPVDRVELDRNRGEGGHAAGDRSSLQLRRVRVDEAVLRRFVEEAWVPFWRAIAAADDRQRLSSDWNRSEVVDEFRDSLDAPDNRVWVALDDVADPKSGLADIEAVFAGWLAAGLARTPRFLDLPERLQIIRLYVAPEYRGEGLADHLMERALQYAYEEGCVEFDLNVGAGNERARAYYEKLGFEPYQKQMSVRIDDIEL